MYRGYHDLGNNRYAPMQRKYPEDIECIIKSTHPSKGSLYISNVEAAENPQTLKRLGIRAILTCAKNYQVSHPETILDHYKYIPAQDRQTYDLTPHFDECIQFINQTLSKTNLLVHCIAGVSRSVSMVIAYLMAIENMTYDEAYHFVKSKRRIIHPNDGFIEQLKKLHTKLKNHNRTRQQSPRQQNNNNYDGNNYYTPTKLRQNQSFYDKYTYTAQTRPFSSDKYTKYDSNGITRSNTNAFSMKKNYYQLSNNRMKPYQFDINRSTQSKSLKYINDEKLSTIKYNNSPQKYKNPNNVQSFKTFEPTKAEINKNYFEDLNSQLNKKIQAIRDKYEKQRQQLLKNRSHNYDELNKEQTPTNTKQKILNNYSDLSEYRNKYSLNSKYQKINKDIDASLNKRNEVYTSYKQQASAKNASFNNKYNDNNFMRYRGYSSYPYREGYLGKRF